jgi:hypothetical protein
MTHAEILSGIVQYAASGADVVRILAENGLVIVPKEPTGEMVSAGCRGSLEHEGRQHRRGGGRNSSSGRDRPRQAVGEGFHAALQF